MTIGSPYITVDSLFTLDTAGKVGIGTLNPSSLLEVNGTGLLLNITNGTMNSVLMVDGDNERVGIGTAAPTQALEVKTGAEGNVMRLDDGTETCDIDPDSGDLTKTCSSDESLKENIHEAESTLDDLEDFKIKEFTVRDSGEERIGIVAQEVQLTHPDRVKMMTITDKETNETKEILGVQTPSVWELVKAIQELKDQIEVIKSFNFSSGIGNVSLNVSNVTLGNFTVDVNNTEPETVKTEKGFSCVYMQNGTLISEKGRCKEEKKIINDKNKPGTGNEGVEGNVSGGGVGDGVGNGNVTANTTESGYDNNSSEETEEEAGEEEESKTSPSDVLDEVLGKDKGEKEKKDKDEEGKDKEGKGESGEEEGNETFVGIIGNAMRNVFNAIVVLIVPESITGNLIAEPEEEVKYGDEFDVVAIRSIQEIKAENDLLKQELCAKDSSYSWC